jgi:hypothetical protein
MQDWEERVWDTQFHSCEYGALLFTACIDHCLFEGFLIIDTEAHGTRTRPLLF